MAQVIGKNTLTGTATSASATSPKLLYGTGQQQVLNSNQKLVSVNVGWGGKSANPTGSPNFQVGLYDVSGADFTTAPLLFAQTFSFNNADHDEPDHWITIPLDVDFSAHAGKTLAVGFSAPAVNHAFDVLIETVTGAFRKNGAGTSTTLTATLASGSVSSNQAWAMYFETADIAPTLAIIDVNGDDVLLAGSILNEATVSGFTEIIQAGNIGGLSLTGIVDNEDGTVNFSVPDPIHGEVYPEVSYYDEDTASIVDVVHLLTLAGDTESDDISVKFDPLSQYSVVLCGDVELADDTFIAPHLEDVPENGADTFWYLTADCTLTKRGMVTTNNPKVTTICHWIASSEIIKIYSLTINEFGVVPGEGSLVSRGIIARGIVARSIVARGL